ncbi:MAG: hypothetical protein CMM58_10605 [Rhodospirillaceae bacterium]|nr:hypothetical protein [Rhodospirillaceae bacterium]|tara:strand:+ start:328 stop:1317 length:990 start_codon:yes stop_codon:yes gene_type:complete
MEEFKFTIEQLEVVAEKVYEFMRPTPQYNWPLLSSRVGSEVWVKHENHGPTGAFKVRGGVVYVDELLKRYPETLEVIAATRGNHGQSVACAASRRGLKSTIVVPIGNSVDKNMAMKSQGAEVITYGSDFQEALEYARELGTIKNMHMFPSFDPILVQGVGTYAWEFFTAVSDLDTVYVPIGLGSGICGVIAVRDALCLNTKVVGVVAKSAPTYALSYKNKKVTPSASADTIADGLACRTPVDEALAIIIKSVERIVEVSDSEIKQAMAHYFTDTHNIAEGAGAAGLAALLAERNKIRGKRVGIILSGGNVDSSLYQSILQCDNKWEENK